MASEDQLRTSGESSLSKIIISNPSSSYEAQTEDWRRSGRETPWSSRSQQGFYKPFRTLQLASDPTWSRRSAQKKHQDLFDSGYDQLAQSILKIFEDDLSFRSSFSKKIDHELVLRSNLIITTLRIFMIDLEQFRSFSGGNWAFWRVGGAEGASSRKSIRVENINMIVSTKWSKTCSWPLTCVTS